MRRDKRLKPPCIRIANGFTFIAGDQSAYAGFPTIIATMCDEREIDKEKESEREREREREGG